MHSFQTTSNELFKTYQVYAHSRTCRKYKRNECRFLYGRYFTEKTIIAKPIDSKFSNEEQREILTWRNTILRQVKSYIDNNLYPAKVNVIDPTKENFTQPLSVKEILNELEISILPELKLRRIFPGVYFVNTNPPKERVQVLLSEKELSKLPDDSPKILKKY